MSNDEIVVPGSDLHWEQEFTSWLINVKFMVLKVDTTSGKYLTRKKKKILRNNGIILPGLIDGYIVGYYKTVS